MVGFLRKTEVKKYHKKNNLHKYEYLMPFLNEAEDPQYMALLQI
jgi:hypothetical protein